MMKTLVRLAAIGLPLSACVDGTTTDDSDTDGGAANCMMDVDADGVPLVFPTSGPLSEGNYTDCEVYTGDPIISYFPKPSCGAGGWEMAIETKGWTGGAKVYIHDSAGGNTNENFWWGEEHEMTEGASEPNEWWDSFSLSLPIVANTGDQVDGTNTYHKCTSNNDTTLVWGIEVFDVTNVTTRVDCVVISQTAQTDGFLDEFYKAFPDMDGCFETAFTLE